MSQVSQLKDRVRRFAALPGMSKTKLSRNAGLSPNALRHIDDDEFNLNSKTLEKLEAYLDSQNFFTSQSNGVGV